MTGDTNTSGGPSTVPVSSDQETASGSVTGPLVSTDSTDGGSGDTPAAPTNNSVINAAMEKSKKKPSAADRLVVLGEKITPR
jgi:hypothetical protein